MNDLSDIESQLRKIRTVQPSADLRTRIERALAEETSTPTAGVLPRERRFHFNWLSLGLVLTAATALVLFAFLRLEGPMQKRSSLAAITPAPAFSTNSNAQFVPAGLTQVVYHTRDEGLHFPNNSGQPLRRARSHTR